MGVFWFRLYTICLYKQVEVDRLASLKSRSKQINAESYDNAPSLEEADAILAFHGYVERELAAA